MKQIIQSFKTGATILEEVPASMVQKGCVPIQTTRSLVSVGAEDRGQRSEIKIIRHED